ncbi:hypothetical protein K457DRAFT_713495 [Linnemannia elongata AG-77]|uniref:Uncharacterized protein n=1 Tax=Linnemannia elongata AG-77 TaxID=1314771 RepID=A0A197KBD4_9FUNG|nr:hypothetical protein K457DRAFT_713495 [Linnemannia elongata AG-77]
MRTLTRRILMTLMRKTRMMTLMMTKKRKKKRWSLELSTTPVVGSIVTRAPMSCRSRTLLDPLLRKAFFFLYIPFDDCAGSFFNSFSMSDVFPSLSFLYIFHTVLTYSLIPSSSLSFIFSLDIIMHPYISPFTSHLPLLQYISRILPPFLHFTFCSSYFLLLVFVLHFISIIHEHFSFPSPLPSYLPHCRNPSIAMPNIRLSFTCTLSFIMHQKK